MSQEGFTEAFLDGVVRDEPLMPRVKQKIGSRPVMPPKKVQEQALEIIERSFSEKKRNTFLTKADKALMGNSKAVAEAFKHFEDAVGGRDKLVETLRHCPENSTGHRLVQKLLATPEFLQHAIEEGDAEKIRLSLQDLCGGKGISFAHLVGAFKDAKTAQITLESLLEVQEHVKPVMNQVAQAAQDRWIQCRICEGTGRIPRTNDTQSDWAKDEEGVVLTTFCFNCRGKGEVFAEHDFQNRKVLLDFVGINKKEPLVQQNFDNRKVSIGVGLPGEGGFEDVMKKLDLLVRTKQIGLGGGEEVLEAEILGETKGV